MDFLTIILGIIGGTVIFKFLSKKLCLEYTSFLVEACSWFACIFISIAVLYLATYLVGAVFGVVNTLVTFLFKLAVIAGVGAVIYYVYLKINKKM